MAIRLSSMKLHFTLIKKKEKKKIREVGYDYWRGSDANC